MRILALGAHPDDIEIFMFGTLAAYRAMGAKIGIAIATDGARGGTGDADVLREQRREEATTAAQSLGTRPHFLDFPDGSLSVQADLGPALAQLLETAKPDLILTHAPNDYHGDHRALGCTVSRTAAFKAPVMFAETLMGVGFVPTVYVDISAHFPAKLNAIRAHASQDPERFVEMVTLGNRFRAGQCNGGPGTYAECFRFEPSYPFADIRALLPPPPPIRAGRVNAAS